MRPALIVALAALLIGAVLGAVSGDGSARGEADVSAADGAARAPFQHEFHIVIPPGTAREHAVLDVPSGKRLVIEHVSETVSFGNPEGTPSQLVLSTALGRHVVDHFLVPSFKTTDERGVNPIYTGSENVEHLYAQSFEGACRAPCPRSPDVKITCHRGDGGNRFRDEARCVVTISGFLEDV
jgi:hypothetical protein